MFHLTHSGYDYSEKRCVNVAEWFVNEYLSRYNIDINIHHCRLVNREGVYGWCWATDCDYRPREFSYRKNQDSTLITHDPATNSCVLGVFDGHGEAGNVCSLFLKRELPLLLSAHPLCRCSAHTPAQPSQSGRTQRTTTSVAKHANILSIRLFINSLGVPPKIP